jgi:hypothetical protein
MQVVNGFGLKTAISYVVGKLNTDRNFSAQAEDNKAEYRPVPPFAERRANAAQKYHDRMGTACHPVASLIVNYAIRQKFAAVRYDDSDLTYCEEFPWSELTLKVAEKCDAAGLTFEHASVVLMNER